MQKKKRQAIRRKLTLQKTARKILGPGPLEKLFAGAAQRLNCAVPTSKITGYALLETLCQRYQPLAPPLTVAERKSYQDSAPCWSRPSYTVDVNSDAFLASYEWRRVRMTVLKLHGARCQCCGATAKDGIRLHVDHIKPRRQFPELALDTANLQVLCEVCNHGKGNWDHTDWRPKAV